MKIDKSKQYYDENKEVLKNIHSKTINNRVKIIADKGNLYRFVRRKNEMRMIAKDPAMNREQINQYIYQLHALKEDITYLRDRMQDISNLLVMKGIDKKDVENKETNSL